MASLIAPLCLVPAAGRTALATIGHRLVSASASPSLTTAGLRSRSSLESGVLGRKLQLSTSRATLQARRLTTMAAIKVGDKLPEAELSYFDKDGALQTVKVSEMTAGKKVVLFAVPGAFTPTCSQKHLPGFVESADALKAKGVDTIACVSVNDAFVMKAWGEQVGVGDKVLLLADGSGTFTQALGVSLDLTDKGLGIRSRRYALLAVDGVVKTLNLEEGGAFTVSGPQEILAAL